ncbi:hypothetical protein AcetOrient_orf02639 [Acetobacter orientalis]|uniref:Uncharacterized protein n=1 Tax=Acetobacter orientalis TaxID=146474 RepID=A0A2Z5ZHB8_9PROT|nr:hypothetical protein AcetOrient_orf02639 [Acetobacter orientalis]
MIQRPHDNTTLTRRIALPQKTPVCVKATQPAHRKPLRIYVRCTP